jgi:hypothetical protein
VAAQSAASAKSKESIRKLRSVAGCIGRTTVARNVPLLNIEKVDKGLKTSLPELFSRL